MKPLHALPLLSLMLAATSPATAQQTANDYPTSERVLYVQECMRANPGPSFEMISKCSCAIDYLAREIKHDEYVEMQTITKAMTIGGERGNDLRDNETLKPKIRKWRELQAKAQESCFIQPR